MDREDSPRPLVVLAKAIGLSILCVIVVSIVNLFVFQGVGRPVRWELPAEYRGWVVAQFDRPACPPLEAEGLHFVMRVPPSGCVCTSSTSVWKAWRLHQHVYVQPDGARTPIEGRRRDDQAIWPVTDGMLFVGSKGELDQWGWSSRPRLRNGHWDSCPIS